MLKSEGPYARYLIGRAVETYDYINQTLPLLIYKVRRSYSPLSLLCITMILRVRRIFFEITTFPNISLVRGVFRARRQYSASSASQCLTY